MLAGVAEPIDLIHLGRRRAIGAWFERGLIIDPGPASCLDALLDGLDGAEPRAVLLTHIHLDHAGASGVLARRFPELRFYVHEIGAPHLTDPSRLLRSVARLYGEENMEHLWGEVAPVPAERIVALAGGESVEGMSVLATPGHASHHVSYLDESEGSAYVGDVAGVRVAPGTLTVMPTPPPEIDVEAWVRSIDALADRRPERLRLTHFGEATDAGAQLETARESLNWAAALSRQGRAPLMDALGARIAAEDPGTADSLTTALPPEHVWLGLERYWRKRQG